MTEKKGVRSLVRMGEFLRSAPFWDITKRVVIIL